jgi:GNAT superfamily N-acetyltransferase
METMKDYMISDINQIHSDWKYKAPINQVLDQVLEIQENIPEFTRPYVRAAYRTNIETCFGESLALIATYQKTPVGYLVSYNTRKYTRDNLYLWMGGVVPEHRRKGIMSAMFSLTEWWAAKTDYKSLSLKTFPEFEEMRSLVEKQGFKPDLKPYQKKAYEQPGGMLYRKKISKSRLPLAFRDSKAYKACAEKFYLDLCWDERRVVLDWIAAVERYPGEKFIPGFDRMTMKSGREFDFVLGGSTGFKEGDRVEYTLNGRISELAWIWHPGIPAHFRHAPRIWPSIKYGECPLKECPSKKKASRRKAR